MREGCRNSPNVPKRAFVTSMAQAACVVAPAGEFHHHARTRSSRIGPARSCRLSRRRSASGTSARECLQLFRGSRYCETDGSGALAWRLFGAVEAGVGACPGDLRLVHRPRSPSHYGVCPRHPDRDRNPMKRAHRRLSRLRDLAIAFLPLSESPPATRTGYLGASKSSRSSALDFSAWFEAYLGGNWYGLDARHNPSRAGTDRGRP